MSLYIIMIEIIYVILGVIISYWNFKYAKNRLKRVNRIRGKIFTFYQRVICVFFGIMIGCLSIFVLNLIINFFSTEPIITLAIYLFILNILIVTMYPLWESFFLGRPTTDAITDYHKFIERRFIDKFQGKKAYLASLCVYLITYIFPILFISFLFKLPILSIVFLWSVAFPLFFISYFGASGLIVNILQTSYKNCSSIIQMDKSNYLKIKNKNWMQKLFPIFAWVPLLLELWNIILPVMLLTKTGQIHRTGTISIGIISIDVGLISLIAVLFVVRGFFSRFWVKKTKTKTIDFVFTIYIISAISLNLLVHFITLNPEIIERILIGEIIGTHPLASLIILLENNTIMLPILIVQHCVTFLYAILIIIKKNNQFQADIRLTSVHKAAGNLRNFNTSNKIQTKEKINSALLIKSTLIHPEITKIGVDINEQVRDKAAQYILMICKNEIKATEFINFYLQIINDFDNLQHDEYSFKQAIRMLGKLGDLSPKTVIVSLFRALIISPIIIKREILESLAIIGKSNLYRNKILDMLLPFIHDEDSEIKKTALMVIAELSFDLENPIIIFEHCYQILRNNQEEADLIEVALSGLLKLCTHNGDLIEIKEIDPFLTYVNEKADRETLDFILQNTISIFTHIAHIFPEKIDFPKFLKLSFDSRNFIRYITTDLLGNFILSSQNYDIIQRILDISLEDEDDDVRDMAIESIQEFLYLNPNFQIPFQNKQISIIDYYISFLDYKDQFITTNASEALRIITPSNVEQIYNKIIKFLDSNNEELIHDCLLIIGNTKSHAVVDLNKIIFLLEHNSPYIQAAAIETLGNLAIIGYSFEEKLLFKFLHHADPHVRYHTIFALGKIGIQKPELIIPYLIRYFYEINHITQTQELGLIFEAIGKIGEYHPSKSSIALLQQALMGDTSPLIKDVAAKALFSIGKAMIEKGKAIQLLKWHELDPSDFSSLLEFFKLVERQEYDLGDVILILVDALQLKGIPSEIMFNIGDALQDLLPAFVFYKHDVDTEDFLDTLKILIRNAFESNYSKDILILLDRISSLQAFRKYVESENPEEKKQYLFYTTSYTPDAEQFFDQGLLYSAMNIPKNTLYAQYSFEIAISLGPNEIFTPLCFLELGKIYLNLGNLETSKYYLHKAKVAFSGFDDVKKIKDINDILVKMP